MPAAAATAREQLRVVAFTEILLKDGEWDGPTPQGDLLTYTSKTQHAEIGILRGPTAQPAATYRFFYDAGKTIFVFADSVYLPEGATRT